jgi:calcineurin-like phosphoesterase family protein
MPYFGKLDPARTFFISDTHFGHANIIAYSNRPFSDLDQMRTTLVKNWVETIGPEDWVFHLGDFAMGHITEETMAPLMSLPGKKVLVAGNHDESLIKRGFACRIFEWVVDVARIDFGKRRVVCSHYPWSEGCFRENYSLHGHEHGNGPKRMRALDVGVDNLKTWRPMSWTAIKEGYFSADNS